MRMVLGVLIRDAGSRIDPRSCRFERVPWPVDIVGKGSLRAFNPWVHQEGTTSVWHSMREMDIMQY
jgi:hypothetical protein